MDHLTIDPKSGRYKYRRRVPKDLKGILGKSEFSISLRTSESHEATRQYQQVHKDVEAQIAAARTIDPEMVDYEATVTTLRQRGLILGKPSDMGPVRFEDNPDQFIKYTDAALSAKSDDEEDRILNAKFYGFQKPPVRLNEVKEAYLRDRADADNSKDLEKQTDLVCRLITEVTGDKNPALISIDIDVAYAFRDHMMSTGRAWGTVKRRISTMKAVVNFGIQRFSVVGYMNPFSSLSVPRGAEDRAERDKRAPLSGDEIHLCATFVQQMNQDLADLWVLMAFTGAQKNSPALNGVTWRLITHFLTFISGQTP